MSLPRFLQSESFPYSSIAIVHVDGTVTELVKPVVTVRIVPLNDGPVVDIALGHVLDEQDDRDDYFDDGAACSAQCGFCGRCS